MIYTHLIAALLAAVLSSIGTWTIQSWRYDAKELERAELQIALDRESRTLERKRSQNVIDAQNSARVRDVALRRDSDAARLESDGLRDDLAAIRRQLPGLADDAVRRYADAASVVFSDCSRKYQEVAGAASGHASDVKTLEDAWPK
ncbi:hypothetical protein [Rhodoferax ferrireducens]|uniref:hypothetical protein n=1 Tax=Rhodoferax ferrireducens TaxID=192843 RepID=UPI001300904B|nr:hypothetical protein [Rhodoferax ferrireducens]